MNIIFLLSGVPIIFLRLCEPFVLQELKKVCRRQILRDKGYQGNNVQYSKESLDTFLNSALNIEFVTLIIQGVTNVMDLEIYASEVDASETFIGAIRETALNINNISVKNAN